MRRKSAFEEKERVGWFGGVGGGRAKERASEMMKLMMMMRRIMKMMSKKKKRGAGESESWGAQEAPPARPGPLQLPCRQIRDLGWRIV